MTNKQLGFKAGKDLDDFKGQYVLLITNNGDTYSGKFVRREGPHFVLVDVPSLSFGPEGQNPILDPNEHYFRAELIRGFTETTKNQLKSQIENKVPFKRYLREPVRVQASGEDHVGIVQKVSQDTIFLCPVIVQYLDEYGSKYRLEEETPVFIKNPTEVIPMRQEDLEQLVKSSERAYEHSKRTQQQAEEELKSNREEPKQSEE